MGKKEGPFLKNRPHSMSRTQWKATPTLTHSLPPEMMTLIIDAVPLESTPAAAAVSKYFGERVLESWHAGGHRECFSAKKRDLVCCGDCGAKHVRSNLRQC